MPRTRMTNPFDPRAGLCRVLNTLAATLAITLALAGCGPGTGGTGTGPIAPTLGYSGSLFATTTAGAASTTAPSTGCATDCPQAHLRLDTERVELAAPCLRFVFTGIWPVDTNGLAVLAGTLETARGTAIATSHATLRLQFSTASAASPVVTLTLTDATAGALFGPVPLLRNDAATGAAAPACGPA